MTKVVAEYGHRLPSEAEAVASLSEVLGPTLAEGLWSLAARSLDLQRPVESPADLRRVAEQLMHAGDLARVTGRSLKVRVITYEALAGSV